MSPSSTVASTTGSSKTGSLSSSTVTVSVASPSGTRDATVELPAELFDAKVNVPLIHQVVVAQQAAARQGTHATRSRGAVRGGGKKPYRQKGTGRARQGSVRAPQFTGGGVVHGPVPRSYQQRTPKKMKAAALRGALSDRAAHGRVHVVTSFTEGSEPKTKDALAVLSSATGTSPASSPMLVVAGDGDVTTRKSLRNVAGVHMLASGQLNTYDVLVSDHVVFTAEALAEFLARSGLDVPDGLRALADSTAVDDTGVADSDVADSDVDDSDVEDSDVDDSAVDDSAVDSEAGDETTEPEDEQ